MIIAWPGEAIRERPATAEKIAGAVIALLAVTFAIYSLSGN